MEFRGLGQSQDSPGESGDVYAAFAHAMQVGGCPYDSFTPEACNAGFGAWQKGISNGLLKIDPASFHFQGQTQQFMYSVLSSATASVPVDSSQAEAMIASAAASLGITKGAYIAPVLATPVVVPAPTTPAAQITGADTSSTDNVTTPLEKLTGSVSETVSTVTSGTTFGVSNILLLVGAGLVLWFLMKEESGYAR